MTVPPNTNTAVGHRGSTGGNCRISIKHQSDHGQQFPPANRPVAAPDGSTATLTGADTVSPTFTPDVGGDYVIDRFDVGRETDDPSQAVVTVLIAEGEPVLIDSLAFVGAGVLGEEVLLRSLPVSEGIPKFVAWLRARESA